MRLVPCAPERNNCSPLASHALDKLPNLIDDGDGVEIAVPLRITPGKQAVATENYSIATGIVSLHVAQHHAKFKTRALPGQPDQLATEWGLNSASFSWPLADAASAMPQSGEDVDMRQRGETHAGRCRWRRHTYSCQRCRADTSLPSHLRVDPRDRLASASNLLRYRVAKPPTFDAAQVTSAALHPKYRLLAVGRADHARRVLELVLPPPKLVMRRSDPSRLER